MNTKNINQLRFYFFACLAILIISFIVLSPSFNLAFEDEEWHGIVQAVTTYSTNGTSPTSRLISPYRSPLWFINTLYTWLGPNFFPYFILSFILRNLVAFSVLVFLYIFTKNRLASFLGGVMVAVGFSGIQNTFEIINMISYASFIGLLIFSYAFFKTFDKLSIKYLITIGISLLLTTLIASVRTYPLYAWAFIIDGLRVVLMRFRKDIIKPFLARQLVILSVFLFLYKIGIFSFYSKDVSPEKKINDLGKFVSDNVSLLASLNSNIVVNFLKGLGNIIFPDILDKSGIISLLLGIIFIISFIGVFIYTIKRRTEKIHSLFSFLFWPLLFYTSYFLVYINGAGIIKDTAIFHSYIRYQLPPFIGFSIFLGILLSITLKQKNRLNFFFLIFAIVLLFTHALTTHIYLSNLSKVRDGSYMIKIWNQIKQLVPQSSLDSKKMNVFYFETDGSARAIYTVNDGFIGHAIAVYKIDSKSAKFDKVEISSFGRLLAPPIITFEELLSYLRKSLSDNPEPDIWNRIFALRVEGDRVINIKENVKKRYENTK